MKNTLDTAVIAEITPTTDELALTRDLESAGITPPANATIEDLENILAEQQAEEATITADIPLPSCFGVLFDADDDQCKKCGKFADCKEKGDMLPTIDAELKTETTAETEARASLDAEDRDAKKAEKEAAKAAKKAEKEAAKAAKKAEKEAEKEAAKAAKEAEKEAKKASTPTEPKTGSPAPKTPGIIASILEFVTAADPAVGITREEVHKKLIERFPDRAADSMRSTIQVQLPGNLTKFKGVKFNIRKEGKTAFYSIMAD